MRPLVHLLAACALAMVSAASMAAPVTVVFSGQVTSDPFGISAAGAPITGSFTFDRDATDADPTSGIGSYPGSGPGFDFSVDVDGLLFAVTGAVTVNVANDIGADQYGVIAQDADLTLQLFLEDPTQAALASEALPPGLPPLAAFAVREFRLFSQDAEFLGSIDALRCTAGCDPVNPTPAPGTLLLGAVALGALGALGARRHRRNRAPAR